MLMPTRPSVDFHFVERKHAEIHGRLENWSRWCLGTGAQSASPMFRLYRSSEQWQGASQNVTIDGIDASKIAKAVVMLPVPHRLSIHWCYIRSGSPKKMCQKIGTSLEGLALFIRDGRQMLLNRRV